LRTLTRVDLAANEGGGFDPVGSRKPAREAGLSASFTVRLGVLSQFVEIIGWGCILEAAVVSEHATRVL